MEPNILVIGDLILDHYVWGDCERISPEAPVQVIEVKKETLNLGGACNVANNLVALGAKVFICGMIGADESGKELREKLESLGINTEGLYVNGDRPTTQKSRIMASHQQVVRIDREDSSTISMQGEAFIMDFVRALIAKKIIDCIVLSDYQKGVLSKDLTQCLIALARDAKIKILADPKGRDYSKYRGVTLLTPNKKEAKEATGIHIHDDDSLLLACKKLKQICDLEFSLITLSEDGIGILDKTLEKIPTIAKEVFDVTGAGDTVIASLAYMLAKKENILQSVYFANAAAAVVVSKIGSATASKFEIITYLERNNLLNSHFVNAEFLSIFKLEISGSSPFLSQIQKIQRKKKLNFYLDKVITWSNIDSFLQAIKQEEFKIVFTNGCFDILHIGHIDYLNKARNLGDLLIVGVNSDSSIKRLKGSNRPINSQDDRLGLLCALECVDFAIVFDEDTPLNLIQRIKPDVLVKGGDYANKEIIGQEFAKETYLLDFVEGKSTTNIIQKIQKQL